MRQLNRAAKQAAPKAEAAISGINDGPEPTPPLDPDDPTWAQKALAAWARSYKAAHTI